MGEITKRLLTEIIYIELNLWWVESSVKSCIHSMQIISAISGGITDLSFHTIGYTWQFINCFLTASYSVSNWCLYGKSCWVMILQSYGLLSLVSIYYCVFVCYRFVVGLSCSVPSLLHDWHNNISQILLGHDPNFTGLLLHKRMEIMLVLKPMLIHYSLYVLLIHHRLYFVLIR